MNTHSLSFRFLVLIFTPIRILGFLLKHLGLLGVAILYYYFA